MRRTVRVFHDQPPEQRLGRAIATLPPSARDALTTVAARADLPLVAGVWEGAGGDGGCLVANVVRTLAVDADPRGRREASGPPVGPEPEATLDLRVLALLPELSSRDLNRLIVAWDEAAAALRRADDPSLRRLLRAGLALAEAAAAVDASDPRARGEAGDGGHGELLPAAGTAAG